MKNKINFMQPDVGIDVFYNTNRRFINQWTKLIHNL